jgi:hypothetical protein
MHVPRFPAAAALIATCLLTQACSESEDKDAPAPAQPPENAADSRGNLPAAPETAGPGIDACSLLTAREVESVFGHAVDGPNAGPSQGGGRGEGKMSSCSFASRSDSANAAPAELLAELGSTWYVNVTVWVWPPDGKGANNYMNAMRDAPMSDAPVQEIEGLAEEGVWNGAMHARRENLTVSLDVRPPKTAEAPDEREKERILMQQALERL